MPLVHSNSKPAFNEKTLAYVAGFFDGEGCVNFTHSGYTKTVVLRVMIRNTNKQIIDKIQGLFGGRIEVAHHKETWKISYCWRLDGARAVEFLRLIDRFLFIKRDQVLVAELWDEFRNRNTGITLDGEYRRMMDLLVRQLQWLNRKGPRAESDLEPMHEVLKTVQPDILMEHGIALN